MEADAARLLAAHQDFALQHVIADKFEADAVFDQLAAVFFADAVEHLGGVEGASDGAGPSLVLQHPTQQDGKDLVGIDEVAEFIRSADAVGIAIGAEARLAAVGDHRLAQRPNVRLDGLGVDAGKQRVLRATDLHVGHADAREDVGDDRQSGAIHGVDRKLHTRLGDHVEVGEALDGREVGGQKVDFLDRCGLRGARDGLAEVRFDVRDDGGLAGAAVPGLVLDAVPLGGVVR